MPGTARAYAQVNNGGASSLVTARTKGITSVTRIATGVYCLAIDPALGIDPLTVSVVASPEWGNSTLTAGAIVAPRGATNSIPDPCPAGSFAIRTTDNAGTLVNTIAFRAGRAGDNSSQRSENTTARIGQQSARGISVRRIRVRARIWASHLGSYRRMASSVRSSSTGRVRRSAQFARTVTR